MIKQSVREKLLFKEVINSQSKRSISSYNVLSSSENDKLYLSYYLI